MYTHTFLTCPRKCTKRITSFHLSGHLAGFLLITTISSTTTANSSESRTVSPYIRATGEKSGAINRMVEFRTCCLGTYEQTVLETTTFLKTDPTVLSYTLLANSATVWNSFLEKCSVLTSCRFIIYYWVEAGSVWDYPELELCCGWVILNLKSLKTEPLLLTKHTQSFIL